MPLSLCHPIFKSCGIFDIFAAFSEVRMVIVTGSHCQDRGAEGAHGIVGFHIGFRLRMIFLGSVHVGLNTKLTVGTVWQASLVFNEIS